MSIQYTEAREPQRREETQRKRRFAISPITHKTVNLQGWAQRSSALRSFASLRFMSVFDDCIFTAKQDHAHGGGVPRGGRGVACARKVWAGLEVALPSTEFGLSV